MTMQNSNNRLDFGNRLDRWILKNGFKAGWPLSALWLIEMRRKFVGCMVQKRSGLTVKKKFPYETSICRHAGYRIFGPSEFPELSQIVDACNDIFNMHKADITDSTRYNKPYFHNILTVDDLRKHPVLMNFALSPAVLDSVAGYLGQIPRLHSIGVFYTAVNDSVAGSQMYHVDGDALSQIKCFVNIGDVDVGCGAFTFLPKQFGSMTVRSRGLLKSMSDEEVAEVLPAAEHVEAVGRPGSGVFVDTSQCLHQGSRARSSPRLVLKLQYLPRPDALLERPNRFVEGGHLLVNRQLVEKLVLDGANAGIVVD